MDYHAIKAHHEKQTRAFHFIFHDNNNDDAEDMKY